MQTGQTYKRLRKEIAPNFTNSAIQKRFETILEVFSSELPGLKRLAKSKAIVENDALYSITARITMRVITRTVLGVEYDIAGTPLYDYSFCLT